MHMKFLKELGDFVPEFYMTCRCQRRRRQTHHCQPHFTQLYLLVSCLQISQERLQESLAVWPMQKWALLIFCCSELLAKAPLAR